jgi:hypothetical protein
MKKVTKTGVASVLGLIGAVMLPFAAAHAESEVLQSSVPQIAVGSKLGDNAQVKIPEGGSVRVLIVKSGTTKTLKGPYEGTVEAYEEKRSWMDRLLGRGQDQDPPIGATRGLRAPDK